MVDPELASLLEACSRDPSDRVAKLVTADWAQEHGMASLEWLLRSLAESPPEWTVFIGSRRYGTPRPDSDFDWVVPWLKYRPSELGWFYRKFFPKEPVSDAFLRKVADEVMDEVQLVRREPYRYAVGRRVVRSSRFGPVNVLESPDELRIAWETAAAVLEAGRPVTRERAVEVMELLVHY